MKLAILKEEKKRIKEFLEEFGFIYQKQDYSFYLEEANRIIGTVSIKGKIIQYFAIDPKYQGKNLGSYLLSKVLNFLSKRKIYYPFVSTNPKNLALFESLGFKEIISSETISLLEFGRCSIRRVLNELKEEYNIEGEDNASVVMNCNPFTLGHKYLVTQASKLHQRVLVFVLEEDSSDFSFNDRFHLVKAGVKELNNIIVLPSTNYLVSNLTFPTYFLKEEKDETYEQALLDALIFKKYFLPIFGISKRYLGEEVNITLKYNQALIQVLKEKVVIFERLKIDGKTVSATNVRNFFAIRDFDALQKLVPKTTLEFLKNYE